MHTEGLQAPLSMPSAADGSEDLLMYELAALPDLLPELPGLDEPLISAGQSQLLQAAQHWMPPTSTPMVSYAAAASREGDHVQADFSGSGSNALLLARKNGSPYTASFGSNNGSKPNCRLGQMRAGMLPPQLPPPEHFPPALQALAEQQRLFMERKYQEQQQQERQQQQQQDQQWLRMQHQQQHNQQADDAQQLARAHIASIQQQQHGGTLSSSSLLNAHPSAFPDQRQGLGLAGHVNGDLTSNGMGGQSPGFGGYTHRAALLPSGGGGRGQSTGFDGAWLHSASETASSFPGFGGTRAPSHTALSPSMSAWPQDQKLAVAMSLGTPGRPTGDFHSLTAKAPPVLPGNMRTRSLGLMPEPAARAGALHAAAYANGAGGRMHTVSDQSLRAAYDAASSVSVDDVTRAPSMEEWSDDPAAAPAAEASNPSGALQAAAHAPLGSVHPTTGRDDTGRVMNKTREKNRVAQRRFRDRQKEKDKEKERKMADMTRRLSELAHEKATLAAHNELLQELLRQPPAPAAAPAVQLTAAHLEGPSKHSHQRGGGPGNGLNDRSNHVLTRLLEVIARRLGEPHGGVTVTVHEGLPPTRLTRQQIEDMPMRELVAISSQYPRELARLLAKAGDDLATPAGQRLTRLAWEAIAFKTYVGVTHIAPATMTDEQVLTAVGSVGETTPPSVEVPKAIQVDRGVDMRALVVSLKLTADQQAAIAAMRRVLMHNMGVLLRRRQELVSSLSASVSISGTEVQQDVTDVFRRTAAVMGGLRSTIWDEYYSLMQMRCYLFLSFTPPQVARSYLATYPGSIDVVALVNCVAEQLGEPLAQALTRNAADCSVGELLELYDADDPAMTPWHERHSLADLSRCAAAG